MIKNNLEVNEVVFEKVCVDKECEVLDGYDGIWVVYFGFVLVVMEVFNYIMKILN